MKKKVCRVSFLVLEETKYIGWNKRKKLEMKKWVTMNRIVVAKIKKKIKIIVAKNFEIKKEDDGIQLYNKFHRQGKIINNQIILIK